jgi:hypothetical protein
MQEAVRKRLTPLATVTTLTAIIFLMDAPFTYAEKGWKTVDEGFLMTIPVNWQKENARPIDSNAGIYKADTADLEFDEVFRLGYTEQKSRTQIDNLKKKEANPKLLEPGEEIWHVDGRIAHFWNGKFDPAVYGQRRFSNVAHLHVPYAGQPGYLSIDILYKGQKDLSTVRRVLKSVQWNKAPNSRDKKK